MSEPQDGLPDEQVLFRGRVVTLVLRQVPQPDGSRAQREIVEHAGGAAVVAVDADGQVLLVRQSRPAVGLDLLELPAGLIDPGEEPIETARRELEEETGCAAARIEPLLSFYTSPGFTTELLHLFLATELTSVREFDAHEILEVVRWPLEVALDRVRSGEVSDAKTVTGLLAYARWRSAG